jgi:hypothetical protein
MRFWIINCEVDGRDERGRSELQYCYWWGGIGLYYVLVFLYVVVIIGGDS